MHGETQSYFDQSLEYAREQHPEIDELYPPSIFYIALRQAVTKILQAEHDTGRQHFFLAAKVKETSEQSIDIMLRYNAGLLEKIYQQLDRELLEQMVPIWIQEYFEEKMYFKTRLRLALGNEMSRSTTKKTMELTEELVSRLINQYVLLVLRGFGVQSVRGSRDLVLARLDRYRKNETDFARVLLSLLPFVERNNSIPR